MKVTIDTNFLISSTQWDYSVAHKLLQKLIRKDIELIRRRITENEYNAFREIADYAYKLYREDKVTRRRRHKEYIRKKSKNYRGLT